ncbi:Protein of unknown function [Gryllus bimaculatus]|nr:Protein of unknown function [Gryllus bimaculatus]
MGIVGRLEERFRKRGVLTFTELRRECICEAERMRPRRRGRSLRRRDVGENSHHYGGASTGAAEAGDVSSSTPTSKADKLFEALRHGLEDMGEGLILFPNRMSFNYLGILTMSPARDNQPTAMVSSVLLSCEILS